MILTQEIRNLVSKWNLRDSVIEKDYVIGWLLWGIGTIPELSNYWAFKGGTALKKCYIETWRFSEDLDFSVLPDGPIHPSEIKPLIKLALERAYEESGINFLVPELTFKHADKYLYTEGKIYYHGPLNARKPARIKLDISGSELIVQPTVLRPISHIYSDNLPQTTKIRCYSFEEIFAEKLRAMGQRGRPRDLYDIVLLFKQRDANKLVPQIIKSILEKKCELKNISVPTLESVKNAATKSELVSEWNNMLGYQVQKLQPFEQFWEQIPDIFSWLEKV